MLAYRSVLLDLREVDDNSEVPTDSTIVIQRPPAIFHGSSVQWAERRTILLLPNRRLPL